MLRSRAYGVWSRDDEAGDDGATAPLNRAGGTTPRGDGGAAPRWWRGWRGVVAAAALVVLVVFTYFLASMDQLSVHGLRARAAQAAAAVSGDVEQFRMQDEGLARAEFYGREMARLLLEQGRRRGGKGSPSAACDEGSALGDVARGQRWAWASAVANDAYVVPLLALTRALLLHSCVRHRVLVVSPGVSDRARGVARRAGWEVVEGADVASGCAGTSGDVGGLGKRLTGAYLRLNCWTAAFEERFDRVFYVDPDVLPLSNVDHLFRLVRADENEVAVAPFERPGVFRAPGDTGFNSGMIVLRPSQRVFDAMVAEYRRLLLERGRCWSDQPFLWHVWTAPGRGVRFFPFAYNVRKTLWRPTFAHHYAGDLKWKPWLSPPPPREQAADRPVLDAEDIRAVFWSRLYETVDDCGLGEWWARCEPVLRARRSANECFTDSGDT